MNNNQVNIRERWETMSKDLKAWEIRLIELRNDGMGYIEISETLREDFAHILGKGKIKTFNTTSLRDMLSDNGKLRIAYETYSRIIAADSLEEGIRKIKQAHSIAASTLMALLSPKQSGATRLGAANSILDRNAGKAVQAVEVPANDEIEELKQKLKGIFEIHSEDIQRRVAKQMKKDKKNKTT